MKTIHVERLIQGTLLREGAGVKLHRYIGLIRQNDFDPILLLDFFDSDNEMDYMGGFPLHPHRGFETVTYMLNGQMEHQDNHGHRGVIGPGDVQWMTAGRGIIHAEMPKQTQGRLTGLQLWFNLPAANKWVAPRYQEFRATQLPVETHPSGFNIKVIAGKTDKGTRSPIEGIATEPIFLDISFAAKETLKQSIPKDHQAILFTLNGEVIVQGQVVAEKILADLSEGSIVSLEGSAGARCLLIAAKKIKEPIAWLGPFVMNTQQEVMQALDDYRNNRF
ncbi:pirin family protein [Legionella clemsonensis]|uniref:Quercetin 2,3-dioxygenase n=1 Tax=Legionella clemsonensis TaxID=1867846 RepID=A0A222P6R4_9GAMM|nr:pirin family protein [Legionella clemsonensis]ASQ47487.1 Quercetin 2,3-dioxygenase [Legionella clemsonensis]